MKKKTTKPLPAVAKASVTTEIQLRLDQKLMATVGRIAQLAMTDVNTVVNVILAAKVCEIEKRS